MTERIVHLDRKNERTLEGSVTGDASRLALHIHGSYGNYWENPFVKKLAPLYVNAGYSYASVNNPGHDDNTTHENFSESFDVIAAWIKQLTEPGEKLILQGHSLGALKIIAMVNDSRYAELIKRVSGIVLLSPFDVVAFYGGENIVRRRDHAKEFRDENGENAIMPDSIFDVWPISAKTFLELSEQGGPYDLFPTREHRIGTLGSIKIPTKVVIGGEDIASYPSPTHVYELLDEKNIDTTFIEGAPHNFAGYEDVLYRDLEEFVASLDR